MFEIEMTGKVAWVSGASRGIGKEIALSLAKAGCDVAVGFRSKESEAKEVAEAIESFGRKAAIIQMDLMNPAQIESAHKHVEDSLGPVQILVNNAGMIADNLFIMLEEQDWETVLQANIMGTARVTKHVIRGMMMKRWGRIINLSSVAATKAGRGQSNYAASKGAIEAMSRGLACEIGSRGITVNCIAPGVIETDMSEEVRKLASSEILDRQIVKRFGTPSEIAAWAVFLASDYGGFITGQTIHIDGGMKMP
jgi:3-oxoacyl-[acyl-carrier protein] reductase